MRIGIFPNKYKDENYEVTASIINILNQKGIEAILPVEIERDDAKYTYCEYDEFYDNIDLLLAVGGDGTLIRVALDSAKHEIPVVLVNLGTLGYLANVEIDEIDEAIDRITKGQFTIDERLMVKAFINNDNLRPRHIGLNEITVSKGLASKIVTAEVHVGGKSIGVMRGDGLIISTPTGSTAYNLSAGGPILEPQSNTLAITPVCPQTPFFPIVVSADEEITVKVTFRSMGDTTLVADGNIVDQLKDEDVITIVKAKEVLRLIKVFDKSHFEVFNKKYFHRY